MQFALSIVAAAAPQLAKQQQPTRLEATNARDSQILDHKS